MLTHFSDIYRIASALEKQAAPLVVRIEGSDETFRSQIVHADPKKKLILLKELKPSGGNAYLRRQQSCSLEGELDELPAKLTGLTLHPSWSPSQAGTHALTFPNAVDYPQRRDSYRTHVPAHLKALVHVVVNTDVVTAELTDLSISGAGISLFSKKNTSDSSKPALELNSSYAVKIELTHLLALNCHAQIKSCVAASKKETRYGLVFEDINRVEERKIAKAVMTLQKQAIH